MTKLKKRILLSNAIDFSVTFLLYIAGAGMWALIVVPISVWSFYDGRTRDSLK